MNIEHVMQLLSGDEFNTLIELAYEEGPEDMGGFRVLNIRTTANRTSVTVEYDTGDQREIELNQSKEHV
jgi:hypothetical protein